MSGVERSSEVLAATVRIGRGFALIWDSTLALIDPEHGSLAQRLWAVVDQGTDLDELVEALMSTGLRGLGDFALVQREGDVLRIMVRGRGRATIEGAEPVVVSADNVRTWSEAVVSGFDTLVLSFEEPDLERSPFRVAKGLVPASQVMWDARETPDRSMAPLDASSFEGVEDQSELQAFSELPEKPPDVPPDASPVVSGSTERWHEFPSVDIPSEATPDPQDESVGQALGYEQMYGETVTRSVAKAAVHDEPSTDDDTNPARESRVAQETSSDTAIPPDETSSSETSPNHSGLIDSFFDVSPSPPIAEGQEIATGDHDGRTIPKSQLDALRGGASERIQETAVHRAGPHVQSLPCASGHDNPPHANACRRCGQPLSGSPVIRPRPNLGRLELTSGERIDLDRPLVIGRNPRLEEGVLSEVPRLLPLDGKALSRSHAMIRLEGWQVLVEDLGSSNGTIVTLPGQAPRRLHRGAPALLEHGASIDFGGAVTATYRETD